MPIIAKDPVKSAWLVLALLLALTSGCQRGSGGTTDAEASGRIAIDGSSTVYPITDAIARSFRNVHPRVWVRVELSGSVSGIERLCTRQVDIANSSRPINEEETARAAKNGVEFIELPVAFDGVAVVVNRENTWVDCLTVGELQKIWRSDSPVRTWRDVRAGWPEDNIDLCGMTTISGTFDYFTTAICGKAGAIRPDYFAHEVHVIGSRLSRSRNGLGFFGYAWYLNYRDKLRVVPVAADGRPPVAPGEETIRTGSYRPLSRPIFIYVSKAAADRPEVTAFVRFYLENAAKAVKEVGYVILPERAYELARARFERRKTGSMFGHGAQVGVSIEELLQRENQ